MFGEGNEKSFAVHSRKMKKNMPLINDVLLDLLDLKLKVNHSMCANVYL